MTSEKLLVFDPTNSAGGRIASLVAKWPESFEVRRFLDFHTLAEAIENGEGHLALVAAVTANLGDELTRIRIIHEEYPALPMVLVLPAGIRLDPAELVRVGAIELLSGDDSDAEIDRALTRAARIGRTAIRLPQSDTSRPANTVSVLSPVGGAGRTFVATNLAAWLHSRGSTRLCLVDLAGPFGAVATTLRLKAGYTVTQACRATSDRDELLRHLSDYMSKHRLGFDVLAASDDPLEWLSLTPQSIRILVDVLSDVYDHVVIDSPSGIDPIVSEIIGRSTTAYVVGTLDVPTLRALRLFLQQIQLLGVDTDQIRLVVNRTASGLGLELDEALGYLGISARGSVPAHDDVRRSINVGRPIVTDNPKHTVSRHLEATFAGLDEVDSGADNATADGRGSRQESRRFLARLGRSR